MYDYLFSVRFQKWRHGGHIWGFFYPMITLFWPISRKLCKIAGISYHYSHIGSHIEVSFVTGLFTLSDLERSIQVIQVFIGLYLQIYSR